MKTAILISGRGSNMAALIDAAQKDDDFGAMITLVISNRADAAGLTLARAANIPTLVIPHGDYPDREAFEDAIQVALDEAGIQFVCLAGFMRVLNAGFVRRWRDRMINIHPSLLPSYKGLDTHQRAIEDGVKLAGCTLHYVRAETDQGPIIAQTAVPVLESDTRETLAARVLAEENRLYPIVLKLIAKSKIRVSGNRVLIDQDDHETAPLRSL